MSPHYHPEDPGAACTDADTDLSGFAPQGYYDPNEIAPGVIVDHDDPRPLGIPDPCFCEGPWSDIDPADRPETPTEREHVRGSIVNDKARCLYAVLPPGATVEPWTDDDTGELAEAMSIANSAIAARWSAALRYGQASRQRRISRARLTADELATAAARFGIVADRDALPLNATRPAADKYLQAGPIPGAPDIADPRHARRPRQPGNDLGAFLRLAEAIARQRELGDVWSGVIAARYNSAHPHESRPGSNAARLYEESDGFEERFGVADLEARAAIYAAGR